jgi:hypothetical protein
VILRASWSTTGALRFSGHHYALEGARPGPMPAHPTGIWLGAAKERVLSLTGPKADSFGFPTFILLEPPDPDLLRISTEDVGPGVRERVAAARAQAEPVATTAAESSQ